jgi:hypothetical protein
MFLSQVLCADHACRETLRKFLGWLAWEGMSASARTAGYCKARKRLPQAELDAVAAGLARRVRSEHLVRGLWRGRPVQVVDGSGLSMPDTRPNQKRYPQPTGARKGCSFPVMRVVALFCLGTGILIDLAQGSLHAGERALFRSLWEALHPGDVLLADRGFCGFAEFFFLRQREVDCVMRAHQRRSVGKTRLKRLGPGDWLVLWHKSKSGPKWPDPAVWRTLPDTLTVREIDVRVPVKGFRTRALTVATTLLDPVAFPAEDFADLYRRRWQAEIFLRDIKTTMGMDVLRCKTPDMVHKELTLHLIAYNLVRLTLLQAAAQEDIPLQTLSFKGALATIRAWAPIFATAAHDLRPQLWPQLLRLLANDPLPHRPNRVEPRARKRRPKNYQLLNKPRHQFKEIHHRSKYVKP